MRHSWQGIGCRTCLPRSSTWRLGTRPSSTHCWDRNPQSIVSTAKEKCTPHSPTNSLCISEWLGWPSKWQRGIDQGSTQTGTGNCHYYTQGTEIRQARSNTDRFHGTSRRIHSCPCTCAQGKKARIQHGPCCCQDSMSDTGRGRVLSKFGNWKHTNRSCWVPSWGTAQLDTLWRSSRHWDRNCWCTWSTYWRSDTPHTEANIFDTVC